MYSLDAYDAEFYATFGHEAEKMAKWFLPLLNEIIPFSSLVDVGCGEGHYVKWLIENRGHGEFMAGVLGRFCGIEGSEAAINRSVCRDNIGKHDLRFPLRLILKHEIALSLEVAEHIEEEYAPVFVETLCSLADVVVMTAAPPGQGGLCHVNERNKDYWSEMFHKLGFLRDDPTEVDLQLGIQSARDRGEYLTPWLLPNIMVFQRKE